MTCGGNTGQMLKSQWGPQHDSLELDELELEEHPHELDELDEDGHEELDDEEDEDELELDDEDDELDDEEDGHEDELDELDEGSQCFLVLVDDDFVDVDDELVDGVEVVDGVDELVFDELVDVLVELDVFDVGGTTGVELDFLEVKNLVDILMRNFLFRLFFF